MSGTGSFDLQDAIGLNATNTVTITAGDVIAADSAQVNTTLGAGEYAVDPTTGSIIDNTWNGTPGNPAPGDVTEFFITVADPTQNIITFQQSIDGQAALAPAIGVEILGVNSQGIIGEQINNYFAGAPSSYVQANLNANEFFVFSKDDLSLSANPTAAELTFGPTICYVAGTRIACASGAVAVEALQIGDQVVLASGGTLPITWIGRRDIDCRRHPDPNSVLPVRIAPHAFGDHQPARPLYLSPEHAVYTDGVLIPIRHLINGSSIRQVDRDTVSYYHVELERHEVLLAEGLPAESFLAAACNRSWFDNVSHPRSGVPERVGNTWECLGCAPLVVTGQQRDAVWARLAERAGKLEPHVAPELAQAA